MYWLGPWEEELESSQCEEAVERVNRRLTSDQPDAAGALKYRPKAGPRAEPMGGPKDEGTPSQLEAPLAVFRAQRRSLPFYPESWWLYRFSCDIADRQDLPGYAGYDAEATVFCVARVEPHTGTGALEKITVLDWTSAPIHRLNAALKLDLEQITDPSVREYLIFFTSFIGAEGYVSEEEAVQPFVLPCDFEALSWSDDLDTLEDVAERQNLELFSPLPLIDNPDPFDFPEPVKEQPEGRSRASELVLDAKTRRYSKHEKREAVEQEFRSLGRNPEILKPSTSGLGATDEKESSEVRMRLEAVVWYGNALFKSRFSVFKDGLVHMDSDEPIAGGQDLPVPRWEVRKLLSGVRILCHQAPRKIWQNTEIMNQLEAAASATGKERNVERRHERIAGDVTFPLSLPGHVEFEDVEFTGRVIVDECVFERSLEFRRCRFLQSLSLKNATVKGSLVLRDSRIEGALPREGQEQPSPRELEPALGLDGVVVDRDLCADRLVAHGKLSGQSMRLAGSFQARGLRATLRRPKREPNQLDFAHSRINGRLDLRSESRARLGPGARVRTLLGGNVSLVALTADAVILSGTKIGGELDLSSACCTGTLQLDVAWLTDDRFGERAQAWRTLVEGSLNLCRASARLLHLDGCYVKDNLYLIETVVSTSVYAEFDFGFRCQIGGQLEASGAAVSGDIELEGIRVAGEMLMITGRCARLRAGPGLWFRHVQGSMYEPQFVPAQVGGIFLDSITVGADVSMTSIQVDKTSGGYSDGGIVGRGVRLGGGFRLWAPEVPTFLEQRIRGTISNLTQESINASIRSLQSKISGDADLRGIRVGGTIDLGRAAIKGRVRLDNAQIEGDLRAVGPGETTNCTTFEASLAKISGDVDLRALVAERDLVANGLEVRGSLLLTAPKAEKDEGEVDLLNDGPEAQCYGRIHLEAATASKLVLTAGNVVGGSTATRREKTTGENPERARIRLARAHVGQLEIRGFKPYRRWRLRFPVTIDLSRIEVGDWNIDPRRKLQPLLASTVPFDRNVFIALEERLAKLGYRRAAHQTWRRMVWRDADESRWRYPAAVLNGLFSRQGTWPLLMAVWLLISMGLVAVVLSDWRNVEGAESKLEQRWNTLKAVGLAFGYAVPPYSASRFEAVRARLAGPSCAGGLLGLLRAPDPEGSQKCGSDGVVNIWGWHPSPYDVAQGMSIVQFVLWILVAANLPAIIRRRN
jgi:hypothetical protein